MLCFFLLHFWHYEIAPPYFFSLIDFEKCERINFFLCVKVFDERKKKKQKHAHQL